MDRVFLNLVLGFVLFYKVDSLCSYYERGRGCVEMGLGVFSNGLY